MLPEQGQKNNYGFFQFSSLLRASKFSAQCTFLLFCSVVVCAVVLSAFFLGSCYLWVSMICNYDCDCDASRLLYSNFVICFIIDNCRLTVTVLTVICNYLGTYILHYFN